MSRNFPVKGLAQLDHFLSALPTNLQKNAIRQGLTAAAAVVRDEARILAPKESGSLAKAIGSSSPRQNLDGTFSIQVRVRGSKERGGNKHGFLGHFFEYGVAPHVISRTAAGEGRVAVKKAAEGKDKITTRPMKIGDKFVSGIIHHPGHAAHPFMRPALDNKADEAVKAFASKISAFFEGKTGLSLPVDEAA